MTHNKKECKFVAVVISLKVAKYKDTYHQEYEYVKERTIILEINIFEISKASYTMKLQGFIYINISWPRFKMTVLSKSLQRNDNYAR